MFLFPTRIHPKASVGVKSHKLLQNNERENKGKTKVKKGSRKDSIEKQVRNEKLKLGSSKEERKDRYMCKVLSPGPFQRSEFRSENPAKETADGEAIKRR